MLQVEKVARGHKTDLVKVVTAWEIENDESVSQAEQALPRRVPIESTSELSGPQPPLAPGGRLVQEQRYLGSGNLQMPSNSRTSFQRAPSDGGSEDRDGTEPADNPELSHDTPNSLSMREDYLPRYAPLTSIPDSSRGKDLRAALLTVGAGDKKYFYSFDQLGNIVRDHEVALSSQSMNKCSLC